MCEFNFGFKGLKYKGGLSFLALDKKYPKKNTMGNYGAIRFSSNNKNEDSLKDFVPVLRRFEVRGLYWMPRKSPWPLLAAITIFCMA